MYLVEQFGQPFTQTPTLNRPTALAPASSGALLHLLPFLSGIWLCGFLVVLWIWIARWTRISAAIRRSVPLDTGREIAALRRLEQQSGTKPIRVLLSRASLEPGVFGICAARFALAGTISEHLDDAHLEAILAHELAHVRRRDNLTAAIHMFVEAVFLVSSAGLVAWDRGSLTSASAPATKTSSTSAAIAQIYAESILKVCEFCLSSPLTCVSGVTGADLKKRMVHIMTDRIAQQLNFTRKLLLGAAAFLAIALPIAFGLLSATPTHAADQLSETHQIRHRLDQASSRAMTTLA